MATTLIQRQKKHITELKAKNKELRAKNDNLIAALSKLADIGAQDLARYKAELELHRWIPVSERLPEEAGEYLVLPYNKHIPTLWYQGGWYWYNIESDDISEIIGHNDEGESVFEVTYWKPIVLPTEPPPKEN